MPVLRRKTRDQGNFPAVASQFTAKTPAPLGKTGMVSLLRKQPPQLHHAKNSNSIELISKREKIVVQASRLFFKKKEIKDRRDACTTLKSCGALTV